MLNGLNAKVCRRILAWEPQPLFFSKRRLMAHHMATFTLHHGRQFKQMRPGERG